MGRDTLHYDSLLSIFLISLVFIPTSSFSQKPARGSFQKYFELGIQSVKNNKFNRSIKYFNRALEYQPKSFETLSNLGTVYFRMENYERAKHYYAEVIKVKPKDQFSHLYRGISAYHLDETDLARSHFDIVLALNSSNVYGEKAEKWMKKIRGSSLEIPHPRSLRSPDDQSSRQNRRHRNQKKRQFEAPRTPLVISDGNGQERYEDNRILEESSPSYESPDSQTDNNPATLMEYQNSDRPYFALGLLGGQISIRPTSNSTVNLIGVNLIGTVPIFSNLSLEGRFTTTNTETKQLAGTDVDFTLSQSYGFYSKLHFTLGDRVKPYGLLGYSQSTVEVCTTTCSTDSDGSVSYGGGLSVFVDETQNNALKAEWLRYYHHEDSPISGINIGYQHFF